MGPFAVELNEERGIERELAPRLGVELDHPAVDALRIELRVPGGVERVGQVHAPPVAAHLDHLRAAIDDARGRMRGAPDDAADVHGTGLPWKGRIRDVVALELPGPIERD